ncbi:MAG: 3-hydroxyacyl-CoA dehydrogenase NAD-binding domain-containing protein [Rhodobacteraceae bacterium]|nr:3-hydroxyacyl-CoA dehydrogenase NAD-binding domain-containing protein [Paracoccaceae bacterium]
MTGPGVTGVVGLGTMGLGIAQVFLQAGLAVLATDAAAAARDSARERLAAALEERVAAGRMAAGARDAALARLSIVDGPADMGRAGLVVEAIAEDLTAKTALVAALEDALSPDAVIATNTSSLRVAGIASAALRPGRVLGLHFFNPAPAMRLVELVSHPRSDPAALARARTLAEAAGKTVVAAPDTPGFIVNRVARPFYGEALALLAEGRSASDIDAAMLAAGYRIGPLSLIDLIGADIHLAATRGVYEGLGRHPRHAVFPVLEQAVAEGRLGRKTGRGFLWPQAPGPAPEDAAGIALRIEATLANEAATLLGPAGPGEEGIDTAMRLGMNFPRGPLEGARALGLDRVRETLRRLARAAPAALAARYAVTPELEALE